MRLKGQIAIVTGGGRGIGRAIALALAKEGANIAVSARTQSEIDAVAAEIRILGQKALAISADVTVASETEELAERTKSEFGKIDILVNNAGGIPSEIYDGSDVPSTVWEWPEVLWDRIIESNLKSTFLCTKAVMPHFIERRSGQIVNIASRMGRIPSIGGGYAAAKYGVIALTQTTGLQAISYGVRVNAVSPGLIDTPGQRRLFEKISPGGDLPPMDSPDSVAAAVLYLLCDAPDAMVGQSLDLFKAG